MTYRLRRGQRVRIVAPDGVLGVGIYLGRRRYFITDGKERAAFLSPAFRLGRRVIHGFECWWLPEHIARAADKKGKA